VTVSTPPRPPGLDERRADPEALIREARHRARRRRLRNLAGALTVALGALWLYTIVAGDGAHDSVSTFAPSASAAAPKSALPEELSFTAGGGIWVIHRDGRRQQIVEQRIERTAGGALRAVFGVHGVEWSPDGSNLLAYRSGAAPSLVLVDVNGTVGPVVAKGASMGRWSPDGTRIAFGRGVRATEDAIFVASSDGRRVTRVGGLAQIGAGSFSWSPDGREIVYAGSQGTGLVVADARGRSPARSIRIASGGAAAGKGVAEAQWSPDGSLIAFRSGGNVNVVRPDGTGFRTIARGRGAGLAWSPDSTLLAFFRSGGVRGGAEVGVVRRDGSDLHVIGRCTCTLRGPGFALSLDWSSDGRRIAYVSGKGHVVSTVRPDGSGMARVAAQPARGLQLEGSLYPWWPLWRPHS
jgi:Tol biopolymer transport system component